MYYTLYMYNTNKRKAHTFFNSGVQIAVGMAFAVQMNKKNIASQCFLKVFNEIRFSVDGE